MHQDCFPIEDNTFSKIDNTIKNNNLSDFGFIGFNIYHDIELELLKYEPLELMTTARTILQKGNGYYMRRPKGLINYKNYKKIQHMLLKMCGPRYYYLENPLRNILKLI